MMLMHCDSEDGERERDDGEVVYGIWRG